MPFYFFVLGDFYEMFFDDAIKASQELEITLTGEKVEAEMSASLCAEFHTILLHPILNN